MSGRFHLAFPVHDIAAAKHFYVDILGCGMGRQSEHWIDFDFYGHQVVAHLTDGATKVTTNEVDDKAVPAFHFGPILSYSEFDVLAQRLREARIPFVIEPYVRFEGLAGEQKTMFIEDPSGNHLEFKAFADESMIFATDAQLGATT